MDFPAVLQFLFGFKWSRRQSQKNNPLMQENKKRSSIQLLAIVMLIPNIEHEK